MEILIIIGLVGVVGWCLVDKYMPEYTDIVKSWFKQSIWTLMSGKRLN